MPIDVKPITKVSEAQKRAYLERELVKSRSGQTVGQPSVMGLGSGQGADQSGLFNLGLTGSAAPATPAMPSELDQQMAQPGGRPIDPMDLAGAKRIPSAVVTVPPLEEMQATALIGSQLWKDMGGSKSLGGKLWEMIHQEADTHHTSPRDYFISHFVKYRTQPEELKKSSPQEFRIMNSLWNSYEESVNAKPNALSGRTLPPVPGRSVDEQPAVVTRGSNGVSGGAGVV